MHARNPGRNVLAASLVAGFFLSGGPSPVTDLEPRTVEAWNRYVAATERRIDGELRSRTGFLVLDFAPGDRKAAARLALARGETIVEEMETRDDDGREIDVPDGSIQHWRGAVLIPGLSLDRLMAALMSGDSMRGQRDVVDGRVLERGPGRLRTFLRLRRESVVTVTYDTEHEVSVVRVSDDRATSRSVATRIVEIEDPGAPNERARPPGDDRGFFWRLNAYWRYEATPEGVIAEVESLTLSRSIPIVVRPFVGVFVNRIARASVRSTLEDLRANLGTAEKQVAQAFRPAPRRRSNR